MAEPWEAQMDRARAALSPFEALLGAWEGEGEVHGVPTRGTMQVRRVLEDSVIEVREQSGDYEDICFYRWDAATAQLRVLHLLPGLVDDHPVEPTAQGLVWVTGPDAPAVEWRMEPDGCSCQVVWPGSRHVEVYMRYRRAQAP